MGESALAKKIMQLLLVLSCLIFTAWGAVYVKKSGILDPYPEPMYFTDAEAAQRPLYQNLTDKEKAVYTALYRGICAHESEIDLPYNVDGEVYAKLYCMIEKQEGALFYIDSTYYTAEKLRTAKIVYRDGAETDHSVVMENELDCAAGQILSAMPAGADDFEKALFIHNYIIENCRYQIDGGAGYDATAYGCLVGGSAHCEGYAKAFAYLAQKAGIHSIVVTGVTDDGENHAWNQVEIDGEWYNCDVTWDDTDVDDDKRHIYFLCNDEMFSQTHMAETNYFEPFYCISDENSYFTRNDLVISSGEDAERILKRELASEENSIELKFNSGNSYNEFKKEYLEGERIFEIMMEIGSPITGDSVTISLKENEKEKCMILWLA